LPGTGSRYVKRIDENRVAIGAASLKYGEYFRLLLSAATQRDDEVGSISKSRRTVNYTSQSMDHPDYQSEGYIDGDHRDVTAYNATRTSEPTRRSYIEPDVWARLPPEVQQILRALSPRSQQAATRGVNAHEFHPAALAYPPEAYAGLDELGLEVVEEPLLPSDVRPDDPCSDEHEPNPSILAHVTQRQRMPPGDIRRVLAANCGTAGSALKHNLKPLRSSKPNEEIRSVNQQTITLNGKRYVEWHVHNVMYNISASSSTRTSSLVDRGANGGMAGSDVRLLETGEHFADVRGIADHQVANLPISTVAGLIESHLGPVIAIMHQ